MQPCALHHLLEDQLLLLNLWDNGRRFLILLYEAEVEVDEDCEEVVAADHEEQEGEVEVRALVPAAAAVLERLRGALHNHDDDLG